MGAVRRGQDQSKGPKPPPEEHRKALLYKKLIKDEIFVKQSIALDFKDEVLNNLLHDFFTIL